MPAKPKIAERQWRAIESYALENPRPAKGGLGRNHGKVEQLAKHLGLDVGYVRVKVRQARRDMQMRRFCNVESTVERFKGQS